jgi:hypothetical protein
MSTPFRVSLRLDRRAHNISTYLSGPSGQARGKLALIDCFLKEILQLSLSMVEIRLRSNEMQHTDGNRK